MCMLSLYESLVVKKQTVSLWVQSRQVFTSFASENFASWTFSSQIGFFFFVSCSEVVSATTEIKRTNRIGAAPRTLQSLHSVQLGEQLVDHAVGDPRAVMTPPGRQRLELIEEEDAGFGSLSPETHGRESEMQLKLGPQSLISSNETFARLWKTSRTPCSLAPMYLLRSSGPCAVGNINSIIKNTNRRSSLTSC